MDMQLIDPDAIDRLKAKCHINGKDCWIWRGGQSSRGYGVAHCRKRNKAVQSHRLSWESVNGSIPDGMVVRHKCNNQLCINPAHLDIGTQRDNYFDRPKSQRHKPRFDDEGNPLPPYVHKKHSAYYLVMDGRWRRLGATFGEAMDALRLDSY